jgi:hypothetical protein
MGFSFYSGAANAIKYGPNEDAGLLTAQQVPPPPAGTYESFFYTAGLPRFFLDLRNARPVGPATDWLQGRSISILVR